MMDLEKLTAIARRAIEIGQPMLAEEHCALILRNTQPAQDAAYSPADGWPSQAVPVEYALSGVLVRNSAREDEHGGIAAAIDGQSFKAVFADLPADLQTFLASQQGIDDICRIDGTWSAHLANGAVLHVMQVARAGPILNLVMRKVG